MASQIYCSIKRISLGLIILSQLTACGGSVIYKPDYNASSNSSNSSSSSSSSSNSSSGSSGTLTRLTIKPSAYGAIYQVEGEFDVLSLNAEGILASQKQQRLGQSLYTFDTDGSGTSTCDSTVCINNWPPLLVTASDIVEAPFTSILRKDGHRQWALRDKALYLYKNDMAPGDIYGEGKNGTWHLATQAPVAHNNLLLNSGDGDYFIANSTVWVGGLATPENREGFSLYVFDKDAAGQSNCNNTCATNWPALLAGENETAIAPFSLISRNDTHLKQWAYHNQPLYFYKNDTSPGATNGKTVANWRLARPMALQPAASLRGPIYATAGQIYIGQLNAEATMEQQVLVNKLGFSLYTFDKDSQGKSSCTKDNNCINNWPPLMAHQGAQAAPPFSLIEREAGKFQWALNHQPLYLFAKDEISGDIKGDGVNGVWHLARLVPVAVKTVDSQGSFFVAHGQLWNADNTVDKVHQDFTLYTRTADPVNASTCTHNCAQNWPPFYAGPEAKAFGDFTLVQRSIDSGNSIYQWAYKGKALYFYKNDTQPGDVTGKSEAWPLATP